MRALSLHHIVVPEIPALELVDLAGALGCQHVCLFTQEPRPGWSLPVAVDDAGLDAVAEAMAERGMTAYGVASFMLTPDVDVSAFAPALARSTPACGSSTRTRRARSRASAGWENSPRPTA
jgi:hypothetical protein